MTPADGSAPSVLDPHLKGVLDAMKEAAAPGVDVLPPEMGRAMYRAMAAPNGPEPHDGVATRDLEVAGADGPLKARLYTPEGADGAGLVFLHGGGFVIGDLDTHHDLCNRLAAASGAAVLAVDYRLSPEHRFPAAHDDAVAATEWAFEHATEIGFDPDRIAVGGDSAGGNLAASVALSLKDKGRHPLKFQLLLYPVTQNGTETPSLKALSEGYLLTKAGMDFFHKSLFGDTKEEANPRVHLLNREDVSGVAPAFLATAGFDPLKDEGRAYAERLKAAGVPVEFHEYGDMIHGFYNFANVSPGVQPKIDEAGAAIRKALAKS
jgi:acetyl esterase